MGEKGKPKSRRTCRTKTRGGEKWKPKSCHTKTRTLPHPRNPSIPKRVSYPNKEKQGTAIPRREEILPYPNYHVQKRKRGGKSCHTQTIRICHVQRENMLYQTKKPPCPKGKTSHVRKRRDRQETAIPNIHENVIRQREGGCHARGGRERHTQERDVNATGFHTDDKVTTGHRLLQGGSDRREL